MNLSIGIVGLPNVGKSTLFNTLTKQQILAANYPFATIDPNVGVVPVLDSRLNKLHEVSESKEKVPAVVEFYDIAGLVKGANRGEGLGNQFLAHIRETSAVVMVLRVFTDSDVVHVEGAPDPLRDLEIINEELLLKDIDTVSRHREKAEKQAKSGDKQAAQEAQILQKLEEHLNDGNLANTFEKGESLHDLHLLTAKPQLYVLNGEEGDVPQELIDRINELNGDYIVIDLANPGGKVLEELVQKTYKLLGLISFFTTGEKETRAWTTRQGAKAPEAAGAIHSDFEAKFIRADVVAFGDFVELGGWQAARQAGKARTEGKDYVMQDGDVVLIKHGA